MKTWHMYLVTITVGALCVCPAAWANQPDRITASDSNYVRLMGKTPGEGAENDPELAAVMKRFVYGDIVKQTDLTDTQRHLITTVVLAANQNQRMLHQEVQGALENGIKPIEIREALYQVAPYIGFPKTFEALDTVNTVFKEKGIALPLPNAGTVTEGTRMKQGDAVQVGIYGDYIRQARANAPADMYHIQEDLAAFCFGDTYTRKVLDIQMRELLTMTVLDALGTEPQLKGHIRGNIAVGNDRKLLIAAVTQALPYVGFPKTLNALRCIQEIVPADT